MFVRSGCMPILLHLMGRKSADILKNTSRVPQAVRRHFLRQDPLAMLPVLLAVLLSQAPTAHPRQQGVPIGQGKTLPTVRLTAPSGGWTVDRMLLVEGTVSDT